MQSNPDIHSLIKDLFAIAIADGVAKEVELQFIQSVGWLTGLDIDALEMIRDNEIKRSIPATEEERIHYFYHLVLLSLIDHELHDKEYQMLREIGIKMGMRPDLIRRLIKYVRNTPSEELQEEDLMLMANTYLN